MSLYQLQKLLRDVNRDPRAREAFFASREEFTEGYELSHEERVAVIELDVSGLYEFGVHGLILRPFTLLHEMPEAEYLKKIRERAVK